MNSILQYYQEIKDGKAKVSKWIAILYQYIVQGLEDGLFFYDFKKANAAIVFIENFVRHHEGAQALKHLKLELWQKALICCIFGVVDKNGTRQFREVFIVIARKNGKTLLAAAIALYCTFCDGEYGGRIYFSAPKLEQASLCYEAFLQSIYKEPALNKLTKKRRTDVYVESTNTSAKPLAFNAKKSDGLNVSAGICDEIASWIGDAGLKFYEVLKSSQGARKAPLLISISTAGYADGGIYDELMMRSTRFLLGDSTERRLLPFLYMVDDPREWKNIEELKKANPNMGVSITTEYLQEEIAIAENSMSKKAEFLTKYCNVKQKSSIAWLPAAAVQDATQKPIDLTEYKNCYAVGGLDLSRTTDLTCASLVIEKDGIINIVAKFFMPAEKLDEATAKDGIPYRIYEQKGWLQLSGDNFVDYRDCFNWFRMMIEQYKIYPLQIGYDRYSAQYLISDLREYGFHCQDVFQGYNLTPVIREFEGMLKDKRINIGDNDLLKIHLLDTALKMDPETEKCKIIKLSSTAHIDGTAAVLDAMTARMHDWEQIGAQLRNER